MGKLANGRRGLVSRTAVVGLIVVGALTFGLTSAWAPPNTKWYSTAITAPNPATVPAGAATAVTVRVTNCGTASPCAQNSTQSLGSANLTFPTNLVPSGPFTITQAQGKAWTADVVSNNNGTNTVRLRNPGPNTTNALAPGQSVSVSLTVTASGTCGAQPPIATETKQSNDFSGNGNNFTRLGSEPTLTVSPGSFAGFTWTAQPDASQTAGTAFTPATGIKVAAVDGCGNVVTTYTGANAVFSGLHNSPNGTPPGSNASYGFTWLNGVATSTSVTDYDAETTKLTVTDGTISADSSPFTVAPGDAASLAFTSQPPNWAAKNTPFTAAVTAYDTWGNTVPNHGPVTISLGINPNGATLTCVPSNCQATTDASGVASFSLSLDKDTVGYQLHAEGSPGVDSNKFNVADHIGQNPSGDDGFGSTTNTNFSGQAAVAVDGSLHADLDFCPGSQVQVGPGTVFEAVDSGTGTWTITTQVAKSELVDPSRGASQYDMCLGTTNLSKAPYVGNLGDQATCVNNDSYSWPAKGGCATYDGSKYFWGNVPNAPGNMKKCSQATTPVVLSKNKTGSGDLVVVFCAPYPWDGAGAHH